MIRRFGIQGFPTINRVLSSLKIDTLMKGASASFEVAPERSSIVCCICLIATTLELACIVVWEVCKVHGRYRLYNTLYYSLHQLMYILSQFLSTCMYVPHPDCLPVF